MNGLMGIKRFQTGGASRAPLVFAQSIVASSADDKARAYAQARNEGYTDAEIDKAITDQFYGGNAKASAFDLAELERIAQPYITGGANTTNTGTTGGTTTTTVTGGAGNDTLVNRQTFFAFGDPRFTWNTDDSLATKQSLVSRMLASGFTAQQIRNEISRLEPDRSALTEANFELLGLKLPTTITTVTGGDGNDTIRGGANLFSSSWFSLTPLQKQTQLNNLLGSGYSRQELLTAFNRQFPNQTATMGDFDTLLSYKPPATTTATTQPPPPPLPIPTGGLGNLATIAGAAGNDTITGGAGNDTVAGATRTDFSRLPPELRMAGQYAPLLAERASAPPIETAFRYLDQGGPRDLRAQLPSTWGAEGGPYDTAEEKINWFNSVGATLNELRNYGVTQDEISFMLNNGFIPGTSTARATTQKFGDRVAPLGAGQMSPGLRTAYEIGLGPNQYYQNIRDFLANDPTADAIAAAKEQYGISDVDIQRATASVPRTTAAPTAEEAFRNYIYAGDADPTLATTRGLQYARNLGLNPEQATALFNRSLGTSFGMADYDRVMAENAGLFPAMPQTPTTQVLPTALQSKAPITGGLAFAQQPGQIGAPKYYENIAAALDKGIDSNRVLSEMATYGITTDDLIAARAMFPRGSIQQLGSVAAVTPGGGTNTGAEEAGGDPTRDPNDEGAKAGGLISKYAGGPVMGSPQYFEEGGEVEPMRKYTPAELGSTFDISEYIDPETGRFMINEYRRDVIFGKGLEEAEAEARARMTPEEREMAMRDLMIRQGRTGREYGLPGITVGGAATGDIRPANYYYAKGGLTDIARKGYAEELRQQGRNGDTILAHINPQEAAMLEAMGGSGTINPRTGLPEYGFSWKKLFKAASFVLPFIPGIGLPLRVALSGALAGASTPGKSFDFKRGIQSALMTYAGGKLGEAIGGQTAAGAAGSTGQTAADNFVNAYDASPVYESGFGSTGQVLSNVGSDIKAAVGNLAQAAPPPTTNIAISPEAASEQFASAYDASPSYEAGTSSPGQMASNIGSDIQANVGDLTQYVPSSVEINPTTIGQAYGTVVSSAASDERAKFEKARDIFLAKKREEDELMDRLFRRTLGSVGPRYAAKGGLMALAGGGAIDPVGYEGGGMTAPVNQPRMLAGGGDGMSDSIPATIDGTQPARLADGEFVIPADVVADIGNGSSSAGAKRLYGMMDRVRQSRHGTTKQPPEIKMNRLMPA